MCDRMGPFIAKQSYLWVLGLTVTVDTESSDMVGSFVARQSRLWLLRLTVTLDKGSCTLMWDTLWCTVYAIITTQCWL